jgi:hypothetical protein
MRAACLTLLFLAGLALYTLTLHGDVQPADSGEFQLIAIKLGVAHPPGYPLFSVLGWLFSLVPAGSPYARVSFLSSVASALTLVVLADAVVTAVQRDGKRIALFAGFAGALALATSTTFWAQATTTNIRSLTALFTACMIHAAARAAAGKPALSWFALALGLGAGHHPSLVFVGVALGAFVIWRERAHANPSALARSFGILAATQLVWLYLPLRDSMGAELAPGRLSTLDGFLDHVLARGFGGDMLYFVTREPERFWDRIALLPMLLNTQFSQALLGLMAACALIGLLRHRGLQLALIAAFALHMFITLTYRAPQTIEYGLPDWVLMCAALGVGLASCRPLRAHSRSGAVAAPPTIGRLGALRRAALPGWAPGALIAACACVAALADGVARYPSFAAAAVDRGTRKEAEAMLRAASPNGAILGQWHQMTPIWALQRIDGIRRDVDARYVAPAGAQPYAETVAQQARALAAGPNDVYVTSLFAAEFAAAGLRAQPVRDAPGWRIAPRIAPTDIVISAVFDARIAVFAAGGLDGRMIAAGQTTPVDLWWRASGPYVAGESISVRVLRRDGRLAATADVQLTDDGGALSFQRVQLALPLDLDPGDYDVLAGAYRADGAGFTPLKTPAGAAFVRVAGIVVTPASAPAATRRPALAECVTPCAAPQLIGVDYDLGVPNRVRLWTHWKLADASVPVDVSVLNRAASPIAAARSLPGAIGDGRYFSLPFDIPPERGLRLRVGGQIFSIPDYRDGERYVPFGDQMALIDVALRRGAVDSSVDLTWLAARPITRDWIVSVRLTNPTRLAVAHDSVPALGAVPTLKWIRGMRVVDRHPLRTDDAGPPYTGAVVVYDSATRLTLPVLDERYERGFEFAAP